jgi:hypothetical protein
VTFAVDAFVIGVFGDACILELPFLASDTISVCHLQGQLVFCNGVQTFMGQIRQCTGDVPGLP